MSNPFDALNISDDQQDQFVDGKDSKVVRKTHKERRQLKKLGTDQPTKAPEGINTQVPARVRDNAKQVRHNRHGDGKPIKGIPEGHTLDRRSGTGRVDRPRKQGGGRGNIGNVHDELVREKYEKPTEQVTATTPVEQVPQEQQKPEEPQALTLAEYYQSKGVDINVAAQRKAPVKGQVSAEWLKKEKLTLVETKEDKKRQQVVTQSVLSHNNTRVELGFENSSLLGFGTKPVQKPREEEQPQRNHNEKPGYKGKKVQQKVVIKEEDFPSL